MQAGSRPLTALAATRTDPVDSEINPGVANIDTSEGHRVFLCARPKLEIGLQAR